jgi:hypothetical protein
MKLSTLANILILGSLLLLSPLAEQPTEVRVIQQTPISYAVEIHQPKISIKSSVIGTVNYNITFVDDVDVIENLSDPKSRGELTTDNNEVIIDVEKVGFFIFEFLSTSLGTVTIQGEGIDLSSWFYILIFAIFRLAIWIREQYF